MSFDQADKFREKWEGGLTNNPSDPGGITKYGVSLRWLKSIGYDVNNDGDIDAADIRSLTPDQARELFRSRFWDTLHLDNYPLCTAVALYDAAVNTGPAQAVKFLQRACSFYFGHVLADDGVAGPHTKAAVLAIATDITSDLVLAARSIKERKQFYANLAARKPSMGVFLKGWLNRCADLEKYLQVISGVAK